MARKHFDKEFYKLLDEFTGTKENSDLYRSIFGKMSDKQLRKWLEDCADGTNRITITAPNYTDIMLNTERNLKIGKRIGVNFFQKLKIVSDDPEVPTFTTPNKFMVVLMTVGRATQSISTSAKMPTSTDNADHLTGQASHESEGIGISKDEVVLLTGIGLKDSIKEVFSVGGGDAGALRTMKSQLANSGASSLDDALATGTGVGSIQLTDTILRGMHIATTLKEK